MFTRRYVLLISSNKWTLAFEGLYSTVVSPNQHCHDCYRELGIFLQDVFWINGLPIVREMYDEFFPNIELIMDQRLHKFLWELFQHVCMLRNLEPSLLSGLRNSYLPHRLASILISISHSDLHQSRMLGPT